MTVTVPPPAQILHWLGGPIDVRVEVDTGLTAETTALWDEALWDVGVWGTADPAWEDITPLVLQISGRSAAARWGERFEAGSATITVDNTTGVFTPDADVPFFSLPFRPCRKIRIVAIPDETTGIKVPLFTGEIDEANDNHDAANYDLTTDIICSGVMAVLAAHNPQMLTTPTGVQTTTERVTAALDRMDWPIGERDLQTGLHTMQTSFLAQSTLEECGRAADAEGGAFFTDAHGWAVFKARDWLTTDPRSVNIQAYVGYHEVPAGVAAAHIVALEITHEAARIVNDVSFARVGSGLQHYENTGSQTLFRQRSYERTDLENNTDEEVRFLARRYLRAFRDDRARIQSVTIAATGDPDLDTILYDTQFGDRWAVLIEPPYGWGYSKEVHVMGIEHTITADDWTATFRLDDAQTFVIADPAFWDFDGWDEGLWQ